MCSLISRSLNTISLYSLEVGVVHRDVSEAVRAVQDVVAVAHLRQDTLYITGLSLAETDGVPKTVASYWALTDLASCREVTRVCAYLEN